MAAKKIMVAGGIGPSKNFGAPEATRLKGGVDRMLACHIDGVLISKMNLDPQVLTALDYYATDEGIVEKNAGRAEPSGVTMGKDPFDKSLQERRRDVLDRDMSLDEARNPFQEVAEKYAQPGMREKFLSANRVKERGGTRDYEVVKDAKGDDVKVQGMLLAHIPKEVARARTARNQARGNQILKQIGQQFKAEAGKDAVVEGEITR